LTALNSPEKNIITVEDPVEVPLKGVNQVQLNVKAGLTFAGALRAILRSDPDIVLIDEILAVGDAAFQQKCMARIRDHQEREKTIFFVSHNLGAVRDLCTRALLVHEGVLLADGSVDEIAEIYGDLTRQPVLTG